MSYAGHTDHSRFDSCLFGQIPQEYDPLLSDNRMHRRIGSKWREFVDFPPFVYFGPFLRSPSLCSLIYNNKLYLLILVKELEILIDSYAIIQYKTSTEELSSLLPLLEQPFQVCYGGS